MNKFFIINTLCLMFFNCNNLKNKETIFPEEIALIDVKNLIKKIDHTPTKIRVDLSRTIEGDFDDYFDLKDIIYLDNKSPIGGISKIKSYKDKYYILDRDNAQRLFCFDIKGDLIWEFKSKGNGPMEYDRISDFVINEKDNTIDLLDSEKYKIIKLNITNGIAETEFKLGFYGNQMVLYENGNYLIYTINLTVNDDLNYKLLLVNTNQKVKSRNLPVDLNEKSKHETGFRSLDKFNGIIYFTETLNDTIYTIKSDTLKTSYYIDFMDKKYPKELRTNYSYDLLKKSQKDKPFISSIDRVREKDNVLNFLFSYKEDFYSVFYDINKESTHIFRKLDKGKSTIGYEQILPNGYVDKGFVRIVEPFTLSDIKKKVESDVNFKKYLEKSHPEIYNVMVNSDSYTNPILFIYEFKKGS